MSDTISIPSLLVFGAILFFGIRYLFFSSSSSTSTSRHGRPAARRVDVSKVDQVASMFPQLDRRTIAWDLSRNGGNVGATTERVLEGRALEEPPPSFRPTNLNPTLASASMTSSSTGAAQAQTHRDLISRYNLSSKLDVDDEDQFDDEDAKAKNKDHDKGWAATKSERASLFAKRREEMILEARRKMQAQQRRELKGKGREVL